MKKFISMVITISMLIIPVQSVFAENDKHEYDSATEYVNSIKPEFDEMFEMNNSKTVKLKGITNKMLIEFKSQDDALNKVKRKCADLIGKLQQQYGLAELSEANWKEYYGYLHAVLDDKNSKFNINEDDYEYRLLRSFFDIYENKYQNDIVDKLALKDFSTRIMIDGEYRSVDEVIAENLPYESEFSLEYFKKYNLSESRANVNISAAISYAKTYANKPNQPSYHYFWTGDCTNFVSQVLEAGGVKQVVTNNEASGWWHERIYDPHSWIGKHKHSISWISANSFVHYMGVVFKTTNHKKFSTNINKGTIIAEDWGNDGHWDHIGFVTAVDNHIGNYGYRDYKVAQHTNNYHLWTSSPYNHWESVGTDGGKYGRIHH